MKHAETNVIPENCNVMQGIEVIKCTAAVAWSTSTHHEDAWISLTEANKKRFQNKRKLLLNKIRQNKQVEPVWLLLGQGRNGLAPQWKPAQTSRMREWWTASATPRRCWLWRVCLVRHPPPPSLWPPGKVLGQCSHAVRVRSHLADAWAHAYSPDREGGLHSRR